MPYRTIDDLPDSVRLHLPAHALEIFRSAFNSAWDNYADQGEAREEIAFRVAWAAIKKRYCKEGDHWVER